MEALADWFAAHEKRLSVQNKRQKAAAMACLQAMRSTIAMLPNDVFEVSQSQLWAQVRLRSVAAQQTYTQDMHIYPIASREGRLGWW